MYELQAADFLGCKAARKDIIQYLQRVVNSVVDQGEKAAAADASATVLCLPTDATYSRDWHNFQVCTVHCNKLCPILLCFHSLSEDVK